MATPDPQRSPDDPEGDAPGKVWDSPWYWLHLFCVASLVGVMLIAPKFAERQAGVERKFQGRQRAALNKAGQPLENQLVNDAPLPAVAATQNHHVKLLPIYALLGLGAAGSWMMLWRTHFRRGRRQAIVDPPDTAARTAQHAFVESADGRIEDEQ